MFDFLAEGIATLFVFGHVSSRLAMIKKQWLALSVLLPSIRGFLLGKGLNSHGGYNISDALANKFTHRVSVYVNVIV